MTNKIGNWVRHSFGEIAEYHGLIDTNGPGRKKGNRAPTQVTWKGKQGGKHTDNGFRFRKEIDNHNSTFKNIPLKKSLKDTPNPLDLEDEGLYYLMVLLDNGKVFDYLGEGKIWNRLLQHFIKIEGTHKEHSQCRDTKAFGDFRKYIEKNNLDFDFDKHVTIWISKVKSSKKSAQTIHKAEGMALEAYKNYHGKMPNLNTKNETDCAILEGFDAVLKSTPNSKKQPDLLAV